MQYSKFSDGSFVIHRIPCGSSRMSAWFNADGTVKDAEYYVGQHARQVKKGGPMWKVAESIGKRYADNPITKH